jgi:hypothetical protein
MATASQRPAFQVPAVLRALDQWVLWRQETRRGNPTKVPYQCGGRLAMTHDSGTWARRTPISALLSITGSALLRHVAGPVAARRYHRMVAHYRHPASTDAAALLMDLS